MKKIALIALLMGTTANAGSFDPAVMDPVVTPPRGACYPVISERTGEILYWTGSPALGNCVSVVVDGDEGYYVARPDTPTTGNPNDDDDRDDDDRDDDDRDDDDRDDDDDRGGKSKDKGNASANNGKGGNYDKTGHSDNGKGNGKGRR